jgi:hypothetical protein
MSHPNQTLSEQIEQLVREHIAAARRAATEAVDRAFSATMPALPRATGARSATRASGRRRAPAELVTIGERLYEAVCAQPGETMAVLAPELGKTPRELHRPMMVLKRAGRVRSVGQRHQTRYFPAVVRSA